MNKTININLGGVFFHIDENAYAKLKRYLDAIRRSLSDDPKGQDEIIKDIEFRISELLNERIKDSRQVVSEAEIDEIITIMGQPEDYIIDEELFTDSGQAYSKSTKSKKLFRDPDDKFLGGVSSGLAHYFNVDPIWIRIGWLIAVFGLGFGILAYIILWILLPEAKTTAEKLQMEGEPVTIGNIEKKIRAEFEGVSDRVKDAAGEVSDAVKKGYDNVSSAVKKKDLRKTGAKAKSGLQDFIETMGKIIAALFMVVGKFIGVLLIFFSAIGIIALFISLVTAGAVDIMGMDSLFNDGFNFVNITEIPIWLISLLIFLLLGIPLFMLFVLGLFILSTKAKILSKTALFILLGLWLMALLSAVFIGVKQGAEFVHEGAVIETVNLHTKATDTLHLKMVDDESLSNYSYIRRRSEFKKVMDANGESANYANDINIRIFDTDSTFAYLKIKREAHGSSIKNAKQKAENIDYGYHAITDNLKLNAYFLTKDVYRMQEVTATLYLPKDQYIYLDENTRTFLNNYVQNTDNLYRRDLAGHYFRMTDAGLQCLSCEEIIEQTPDKANAVKDSMTVMTDSTKNLGVKNDTVVTDSLR